MFVKSHPFFLSQFQLSIIFLIRKWRPAKKSFLSKFFSAKVGLKSSGSYDTSTSLFNMTRKLFNKDTKLTRIRKVQKSKLPLRKGQ